MNIYNLLIFINIPCYMNFLAWLSAHGINDCIDKAKPVTINDGQKAKLKLVPLLI